MPPSKRDDEPGRDDMVRSSLAMFCFGLTILALLVAIDRPGWFHLRPASGTAAAMFNAATMSNGKISETAARPEARLN